MTNEERREQIAILRRDFMSGWIRETPMLVGHLMHFGLTPTRARTTLERWRDQRDKAQHEELRARARALGIHRVA